MFSLYKIESMPLQCRDCKAKAAYLAVYPSTINTDRLPLRKTIEGQQVSLYHVSILYDCGASALLWWVPSYSNVFYGGENIYNSWYTYLTCGAMRAFNPRERYVFSHAALEDNLKKRIQMKIRSCWRFDKKGVAARITARVHRIETQRLARDLIIR